jgi:hypothetical protein
MPSTVIDERSPIDEKSPHPRPMRLHEPGARAGFRALPLRDDQRPERPTNAAGRRSSTMRGVIR